jgi:hypothetical protein
MDTVGISELPGALNEGAFEKLSAVGGDLKAGALLGVSNSHVESGFKKGHALSPLLLVRDEANAKLVIAGRLLSLSAIHALDNDARIPRQVPP